MDAKPQKGSTDRINSVDNPTRKNKDLAPVCGNFHQDGINELKPSSTRKIFRTPGSNSPSHLMSNLVAIRHTKPLGRQGNSKVFKRKRTIDKSGDSPDFFS